MLGMIGDVSEQFDAVDVIRTKRDRGELSDEQIDWVIDAYTRGVVADEQMAALAMAILLNGMSRREIARWTAAMVASGTRMDWSDVGRPTTDKHSTGGVGDKITLPLAPTVAACGAAVPQLSGRGLGHTGGTLDKLESIPGWRATLSSDEMLAQLRDVGAVVCAAGDDLAPADKKLYALRDVTGTVEAIPLIASSIMSKKIAEGTSALVLDVKVGSGAGRRRADPSGCAGGRRRRVAAGRRTRPQGGFRPGRSGRRNARQAGRPGPRRRAAVDVAHRRACSIRSCAGGLGRRLRDRPSRLPSRPPAAGHRPHLLGRAPSRADIPRPR